MFVSISTCFSLLRNFLGLYWRPLSSYRLISFSCILFLSLDLYVNSFLLFRSVFVLLEIGDDQVHNLISVPFLRWIWLMVLILFFCSITFTHISIFLIPYKAIRSIEQIYISSLLITFPILILIVSRIYKKTHMEINSIEAYSNY